MNKRLWHMLLLASTLMATACAQATLPSFSSAGAGGDGGSGDGGMGGTGMGGMGGSGGTGGPDVDPLDGIGAVEPVLGGFQSTDSPVWDAANGLLLFTDVPSSTIHTLTPPSTLGVFRLSSGNTSGIALDAAGLVIACERANRRVSRTMTDQSVVDVATEWMMLKLNSPEDAIVGGENSIYFTDPPFGLPSPGSSELGFFGVFRVDPIGMMSIVVDDMVKPNGIALGPKNNKLYVSDTETAEVRVFGVAGFGQTDAGMKLMTTGPSPDGICVDDAENLYIATPAGIEVYRSNGTLRGKIDVPELPTGCSFGGMERKTLYITAGTSIYRVDLNVPGLP